MTDPVRVESHDFDGATLHLQHPPVLRHPNKQLVYDLCLASGYKPHGTLMYSKWKLERLPEQIPDQATVVETCTGYFDYSSTTPSTWHVNFADPHLFMAYGSGLFAQDEMQVLEHPLLGCLREALAATGRPPKTVEGNAAAPVLVQNVERVCFVETAPSDSSPRGLYGNRFQAAPADAIRAALQILPVPTRSNLIAIAAPVGQGTYTLQQITSIVETSYCGFRAAVLASPTAPVQIHTGFWGCGAFGGNRPLMVLLQLFAARLARLDRLVFHLGNQGEQPAFDEGRERLTKLARNETSVDPLLNKIHALGYRWGHSDGN